MDTLFKGVTAVTMDKCRPVVQDAYIGVHAGKISYIGTQPPKEKAGHEIDGRGKILMPGLCNAHTHLAMTILRGYADDDLLQDWLFQKIFPVEAHFTPRTARAGALLACMESIRFGVTSLTCMDPFIPAIADACFEAGIKANIGNGYLCVDRDRYDFNADQTTLQNREMLDRWHGADNGRIRLDASVHGEYTSFGRVWADAARFARDNGLNMHIHLSETESEHRECIARHGKTPAAVLDSYGLFETRATVAHAVWVSDEDIDLLASRRAVVAHNPVSNLKLGSGVAPVRTMREKGLRVALGTDSVASNNSLDLFEEIKLSLLLQKGLTRDPSCATAADALLCATVNGAFAQGREEECGVIREGMDADLILLDCRAPQLIPMHNPLSILAYSSSGRDVCLTMVRGKTLYQDGRFMTIDFERLMHELDGFVMPHVFGA